MEGYTLGAVPMMMLGSFQFGINTAAFQELNRDTAFQWPAQDRFSKAPALQFVGPATETLSLPGVIYPAWRGGAGQVQAMRALAGRGVPLLMVDGFGNTMGQWVIESINEKQSMFFAFGVPRKQEFTLNLKKFDDGSSLLSTIASVAAGQGAAVVALPSPAQAALSVAKTSISAIGQAASQISAAVSAAGSLEANVLSAVKRATSIASTFQDTAKAAVAIMGGVPTVASATTGIASIIDGAVTATTQSTAAAKSIEKIVRTMETSGTPATSIQAVKGVLASTNKLTITAAQTYKAAKSSLDKLTS